MVEGTRPVSLILSTNIPFSFREILLNPTHYPLGPSNPRLLNASSAPWPFCAPGLGEPGGTLGPPCGVGAGGGTPIMALGMTIGFAVGGPPCPPPAP